MTMQTTSLEVSRELEKAGFWVKRNFRYVYIDDINQAYYRYSCEGITELVDNDKTTPAATYDDLIPALGLDKPNKDYACSDWGYGWTYYFDITVRDNGFTPDALAKVWIELNKDG